MNEEDKIKVLAELDGWKPKQFWTRTSREQENGEWIETEPPDYLNSYDAIIPLIQKQSRDTKEETGSRIVETLTESDTNIMDATPEKLADALIKAVGKWKD